MKRVLVLIGLGLSAAMALAPAHARALPTEPGEQAQSLRDFYIAGLDYHYGRYGLSQQEIQASGQELLGALSSIPQGVLDRRELCELSLWLFRATASIGALDIAPPPAVLRDQVTNLTHIIALYLRRPRLMPEEQDAIAGQLGVVLDALRAAMLEEFSEVPGAEALVREATYARAAGFGRLIADPVSPLIKRPYTAEEIDGLCAYARSLPAGEAASYFAALDRIDPAAPDFQQQADEIARWTIHGVTWSLRSRVRVLQYTPPTTLTAEEQGAVLRYYLGAEGLLSDEPEAMQRRAEEVPW